MMSARLLLLVAITLAIGACSRGETVKCSVDTAYLEAESAGLLRIPDNLSVPDETDALRVPGPTAPRDPDEDAVACLEYSPAYAGEE